MAIASLEQMSKNGHIVENILLLFVKSIIFATNKRKLKEEIGCSLHKMQAKLSRLLRITTITLAALLILSCFVETTSFANGETHIFSKQSGGSASAIATLSSSIEANGGWNSSLQTIYNGIALGKTTVSQLQKAVDAIDITSTSTAEAVFYWYIQLNKFGVNINETTIKKALDTVTMLPTIGGLPYDYSNSGTASFFLHNRYSLYAYQWAEQLNYQTSKWNLSQAYKVFNDSVTAYGKPVLCVGSDRRGWGISYGPRYYDECAETIDTYLIFNLQGIDDGLVQAKYWWKWENANLWVNGSNGQYYKYAYGWDTFECEAGSFDQIIWKLYTINQSIPNVNNLLIDTETRALSNGWVSPQWADYVVMHAVGNSQQRLENTITSWGAMLGFYGNMTSKMQNQTRELLTGSDTMAPAWNLTLQSKVYDDAAKMFKIHSDASVSTEATSDGAFLLGLLSTVPVTGSLAVPLQECAYQDINNVIDGSVYQVNLENNTVTLTVSSPGTFLSLFGLDIIEYNLDKQGVWQLTFASNWNSIISKNYLSEIPKTRSYLGIANSTGTNPFTPTPTPSSTPTTTPTPTSSPTPTDTPTPEPTPTETPESTSPATATNTPQPTSTTTQPPTPTSTQTPTLTQTPTVTPKSSNSPLQNTSRISSVVIASIVLLAIIIATGLFFVKKRKNKK